nr:hypothetical protein [Corynebacterium lactis]
MKNVRSRFGLVVASVCVVSLGLTACSPGEQGKDAAASQTSAPAVSVNPQAPALTEKVGAFNFIRTKDDGTMAMLATVHVKSADGWMGLVDESNQFSVLEKGKYTVHARGASGCSGVGSPAAEGLGVIGEVHASGNKSVDVWSTPSKVDEDSFTTVALVDESGNLAGCAKSVKWTEPTAAKSS